MTQLLPFYKKKNRRKKRMIKPLIISHIFRMKKKIVRRNGAAIKINT